MSCCTAYLICIMITTTLFCYSLYPSDANMNNVLQLREYSTKNLPDPYMGQDGVALRFHMDDSVSFKRIFNPKEDLQVFMKAYTYLV